MWVPRRDRTLALGIATALVGATFVGAAHADGPAAPANLSVANPTAGASRLPNGWGLHPAGTQVLTNRATTGVAVAPNGKDVYATTSGIFEEAVVHVDASTLAPTPTLVSDTFQGIAADGGGDVWVAGGAANTVWQFKAAGPALVDARQAGVAPDTPNRGIPVTGYPGNMVLAGSKLFVAGNVSVPSSVAATASGGKGCASSLICSVVNVVDVTTPDATTPAVHAIPVGRDAYGLAWRPASSTLYATNWADQTNPKRSGGAGTGTVSVIKVNADGSGAETQVVTVGVGPAGIALSPDGLTLAVANSGADTLSVLTIDPATGSVTGTRTVDLAAAPGAPLGTTPVAAAFSPDGSRLFVTLAGIDAVEVLAVSRGRVAPIPQRVDVPFDGTVVRNLDVPATFIPTGWYPDALAIGPQPTGAGSRLYVANLRGGGAGPGYYGQTEPLVGSSTEGSLSVINLPGDRASAGAYATWTAAVVTNDLLAPLYRARIPDPASNACLPAPLPSGRSVSSAILCDAQNGKTSSSALHVVIIEAENKTFDSYFGDTATKLTDANADPGYTEYGQAVTTNQHNLAETYNVDDNFWNEGAEASTLGHSWLSGAYTTLDRELTWGPDYSQNLRGQRSNGQYGASPGKLSGASSPLVNAQEQTMLDPRQLLIDEAFNAGLGVRLLGTDINPDSPSAKAGNQVPQSLWGESGSGVSSDLAWPDVDRAAMFLHGSTVSHAWDMFDGPTPPPNFGKTLSFSPADKAKFTLDGWTTAYQKCVATRGTDQSCQTAMPNLTYMQLPENHTYDVSNVFNPLDPTPASMVADNDYAIGEIIAGLSKSPFWKNTIVFVTEDDNQFTGDHVDIHRTFLLTAGGLARQLGSQGHVSSQVGSFASIDKTTEVLLGLKPLTLFDARAVPLQHVVADRASPTPPYTAVLPPTPFLSAH